MSDKVSLQQLAYAEQQKVGASSEVPDVSVPLPSKGKVYSSDNVLFLADSVDVRAMTAKDENILSSLALLKKGQNLTQVMKACITNKLVDPEAMLIGDRNAVLIAIRNVSYGPEYLVDVRCPACDASQEHVFDMSRLPMKVLDTDPIVSSTNLFRFELPRSKKEVNFKLLTGRDVAEQDRAAQQRKKNNVQSDDVITSAIHSQVVSIGGEDDRNKLLRLVENMSSFDSLALREHMADVVPGVDMVQEMTCSSCDAVQEVEVPMGPEFFWPSRRRKRR